MTRPTHIPVERGAGAGDCGRFELANIRIGNGNVALSQRCCLFNTPYVVATVLLCGLGPNCLA